MISDFLENVNMIFEYFLCISFVSLCLGGPAFCTSGLFTTGATKDTEIHKSISR
jgi:hypothetical protein